MKFVKGVQDSLPEACTNSSGVSASLAIAGLQFEAALNSTSLGNETDGTSGTASTDQDVDDIGTKVEIAALTLFGVAVVASLVIRYYTSGIKNMDFCW